MIGSMKVTVVTCSATLLLVLASAQAYAARSVPVQPIEYFTRSLTAFYSVLNKCQKIEQDMTPIQASIQTIRMYVSALYRGDVPYWTLPSDPNYIHDPEVCNYLLYDRMMSYEFARREFMNAYPEEDEPPKFNIKQPKNYEEIKRKLANQSKKKKRPAGYDW